MESIKRATLWIITIPFPSYDVDMEFDAILSSMHEVFSNISSFSPKLRSRLVLGIHV